MKAKINEDKTKDKEKIEDEITSLLVKLIKLA